MFFAVDDSFHSHRKRLAAGNAAVGVWTACGSYCGQHLTDGNVPGEVVKLYGRPADVAALVRVQLFHAAGHCCDRCPQPAAGDYVMHDYLDHNPSREEVEAERRRNHEVKSRAGRAGGIASGVSRRRNGEPKQSRSRAEAEPKQNAALLQPQPNHNRSSGARPASVVVEANGKQNEAPTRPVPLTTTGPSDPAANAAAGELIPFAAPITAQTLVAEWVDHCQVRPPGQVIGQVAKLLGQLLAEPIPPMHVRAGFAEWHQAAISNPRGQHPATLPSFVHAAANARPGARSTTDERVAAGLALAAKYAEIDAREAT